MERELGAGTPAAKPALSRRRMMSLLRTAPPTGTASRTGFPRAGLEAQPIYAMPRKKGAASMLCRLRLMAGFPSSFG